MSKLLEKEQLLGLDLPSKLYQLRTVDAMLDPRNERLSSQIHARMETLVSDLLAALRSVSEEDKEECHEA